MFHFGAFLWTLEVPMLIKVKTLRIYIPRHSRIAGWLPNPTDPTANPHIKNNELKTIKNG